MKRILGLILLFAAAAINSSCEKTPKGVLVGTVYMTKDGNSGRVQRNTETGEIRKLDLKLSFKNDSDCILTYVLPNGKDYSRYDGTYTVSDQTPDGVWEVDIDTNISIFKITRVFGELSEDKSEIVAEQTVDGRIMSGLVFYKQ